MMSIRRDMKIFMVFYDGTELIEKMKKLVRFDLIDIKGVFNIVATNKPSRCPACAQLISG